MPIRIIFFLVLLAALTFWQGCGQSDFNDSEVNSAVTTADTDTDTDTDTILILILILIADTDTDRY